MLYCRLFILFSSILIVSLISCRQSEIEHNSSITQQSLTNRDLGHAQLLDHCKPLIKCKPLLSTRFKNLEHFKKCASIIYYKDYTKLDSIECLQSIVDVCYISNGEKIIRRMNSGLDQKEVMNLEKADNFTRTGFVLSNPDIIRQRKELEKAYILARRKPVMFGPGDISFYDLAEASFKHINTPDLAFQNPRDSTEKGYINTFNHITAQAIITSFFSEELADLIADLHERNNMPEITSGRFSKKQLQDTFNSPEDNYVDIINNEIGQKIGLKLKDKYKLNDDTVFTPQLLASYLNEIQTYYMWSLEIGLDNFRATDEMLIKFSSKINRILERS